MGQATESLQQDVEGQPEGAEHDKYFDELPPVPRADLRIDVPLDPRGVGREPAGTYVLLHESVLLGPPLAKPAIELLWSIERDVGQSETAPVEIDGFRGSPLEVRARQAEVLFSVVTTSNKW